MSQDQEKYEVYAPEVMSRVLGFVVGHLGSWSAKSTERLLWRLKKIGFKGELDELNQLLEQALQRYQKDSSHLFLCDGKPCSNFRPCSMTKLAASLRERTSNCQSSLTGCQGPCNFGPIATLRVGERAVTLAAFRHMSEVESLLDFAVKASHSGTTLVDPGEAVSLLYNGEDHEEVNPKLRKLGFLTGRHLGQGVCDYDKTRFVKEVIGGWEAGGRFLGLRMSATYGIGEDFKDTHSAFVVVGFDPESGSLVSRGYTDGGEEIQYPITVEGETLSFPDRVPHHVEAQRARKYLKRTNEGFTEWLELQREDGEVFIYYKVVFKKKYDKAVPTGN